MSSTATPPRDNTKTNNEASITLPASEAEVPIGELIIPQTKKKKKSETPAGGIFRIFKQFFLEQ